MVDGRSGGSRGLKGAWAGGRRGGDAGAGGRHRVCWGLLVCLVGGLLAAGCAGYHLGPSNGLVAGAKTIRINLFNNATPEPRLSEALATAIRRQIQQDGTYRLVTDGPADVEVSGTITEFDRTPLSFQPNDVLTPLDVFAILYARVIAEDHSTGKRLVDQVVFGRTTIRVGTDLAEAEYQAVPVLAADLARNATALIVDGTW